MDNKNIVKNTDNNLNKKSKLLARFRGWIQAAATLVSNINLPNFVKKILQPAKRTQESANESTEQNTHQDQKSGYIM